MHKRRFIVTVMLIVIAVLFSTTACSAGGARVGDLQTKSQTVELGGADSVAVEIQMGAGELGVSGGASELLDAHFTYNVEELNPQATYDGGKLVVKDSDVKENIRSLFDLKEYRNEWDLMFNDDVPMEMTIDLGAGRSNLALGTLALNTLAIKGGAGEVDLDLSSSQALSRLDFDMGAGAVTIDLGGDWQNDLDARLSGGLGEVTLRLPSSVGVRVNVDTGIGSVDASGLAKDGDVYTNDAYGVSDVTLLIDLEAGVGQIHLEVE
jgi:N-terminal domain of toast_rack, DUF2154